MMITQQSSATPERHSFLQNTLLQALPEDVFGRISPNLQRVSLPLGKVLYEPGEQLQYVYFPTTCILSIHYIMENGASAEMAGVGNEGMLGIALIMGGNSTPSRATVQTAGDCYRLSKQVFLDEFKRAGPLMKLMLRYAQALMTQMAQTAVCNRLHSVEQQMCRWLLLTSDRLASNDLTITQESIAGMLGVRRESVTESAVLLNREGLIGCRRGHITVLERPKLEFRACECYGVVKKEFQRLLGNSVSCFMAISTLIPDAQYWL